MPEALEVPGDIIEDAIETLSGRQLLVRDDEAIYATPLFRAERRVAALDAAGELASTAVLAYLNRAADLVYAIARFADVDDPALFEGRAKAAR